MKNKCLYCGVEFIPTNPLNPTWQKYCQKEHGRKHWRIMNPEKYKEQCKRERERIKNNPERYSKRKENSKIRNQSPKGKFIHYKSGAKQRNYAFELTFEQFMELWEKPCSYCGSEIKTVGIDRKNNSEGYTLKNSVPCCEVCNKMKMKVDYGDFINQCKKIVSFISDTIEA